MSRVACAWILACAMAAPTVIHAQTPAPRPDTSARAVIAKAAEPPMASGTGPAVSRASLLADLAGAHDRASRLTQENTQLRRRLSEALGEQAWRESGLGGPDDIQTLQRRITDLEQHIVELRQQLADRDDELGAARTTNRELMTALNRTATTR